MVVCEKALREMDGRFSINPPRLLLDRKSVELAEFMGIMLGDGNIVKNEAKASYMVRISGHSVDDKEYLVDYVKPLVYKLFKVEMGLYFFKNSKSLHLTVSNKNLVYTLESFGLVAGNKIKNNVSIPPWVFENDDYLRACVRGLIDTDGCVVPITGRNYTYIWFSCGVENLRRSFVKAMERLDYRMAKWSSGKKTAPQTYIAAKNLIRKYYKEVGFSNLKHKKRFICSGSVVRPN